VDDHDDPREEPKEEQAPARRKATEAGEGTAEEGEAAPHGPMTIAEAARKGGNTTKQRYGPDFYSRIGRKGGQRVARERGPEFYSEIGRKGGEARVAQSRRMERERKPEEE
jgi:general stress protein YciG